MKKLGVLTMVVISAVSLPIISFANVNMMKAYREVNPDLKADCTYCHVDKLPKKDKGKHEVNAYGAKIKELLADKKELSDAELKAAYVSVFKQLGRHDAFVADAATGK